MTLRATFIAILAAITLTAFNVQSTSAAEDTFNAGQKSTIEDIVRDYLLANPEILIQTIQKYTRRQEQTKVSEVKEKLVRLADFLQENPGSPTGGNPDGDVTVIEFFDYRCGFCKRVFPTVEKLLKEDSNIRYVFKEFPILGPLSVFASRVSLAIWSIDPSRYKTYHTSLMLARGQLSEDRIMKFAEKAGYDANEVRSKMDDPAVEKEINTNSILAQQLGITGTPAFIIGEQLVPGAVDLATLKRLVQAARN